MTLGKLIKLLVLPLGHNSACVKKKSVRVYRKVLGEKKYKLNREKIRMVPQYSFQSEMFRHHF